MRIAKYCQLVSQLEIDPEKVDVEIWLIFIF